MTGLGLFIAKGNQRRTCLSICRGFAFPDICDRIRLLLEELQRDYGTQIAEKEEEVKQLKQQLEIQFAEKDEVVKQQLKEKDEEIKKLKELIKVMKSAGEDVGKRLRDSRQMIGELNQLIKGMEEKENMYKKNRNEVKADRINLEKVHRENIKTMERRILSLEELNEKLEKQFAKAKKEIILLKEKASVEEEMIKEEILNDKEVKLSSNDSGKRIWMVIDDDRKGFWK
ncbi:hypothetical protein QL285_066121 [Trifolium repens]|nr:hypothetical protein QL285_066121 [Trifolium repens]